MMKWHYGVAVITTEQLHPIKSELMFCAVSSTSFGVSQICMVRISDNVCYWKKGQTPLINQPCHKKNYHHHHNQVTQT